MVNIPNLVKASQSLKIPLILVGKQAAEIEKMDLNHPELLHLKEITPYLGSKLLIRPGFISDDELSKLYSQAMVYCHPSFAEGFGIGVANALALGSPVACSQTSCLPEIAGDAAIYFDPESIEDISHKISEILTSKTLSTHLTTSGFAQIKKFSWEKTALETLQVYQHVLKS